MKERDAVMVIEDDDSVRQLMVDILTDDGYRVIQCTTAAEALTRLHFERPSVITLDLAMPGMDGLQFLRELRATPPLSRTPVVVVSAAPGALRDQLAEHVVVALGKPFHMDQFLQAVQTAVGQHLEP